MPRLGAYYGAFREGAVYREGAVHADVRQMQAMTAVARDVQMPLIKAKRQLHLVHTDYLVFKTLYVLLAIGYGATLVLRA